MIQAPSRLELLAFPGRYDGPGYLGEYRHTRLNQDPNSSGDGATCYIAKVAAVCVVAV